MIENGQEPANYAWIGLLVGQAQNPLRDDVLLNFAGSPVDGNSTGCEPVFVCLIFDAGEVIIFPRKSTHSHRMLLYVRTFLGEFGSLYLQN